MNYSNKKIGLILFVFFLSLPLFAQKKITLDVKWKGIISQDQGYRTEYNMEMYLTEKNGKITGKSIVYADSIFAEMTLEGHMHSKSILLLKDVEIIESQILEGMEWCFKKYQLILKKNDGEWILEGHWQGKTSFSPCVPGKVKLQRIVPRA